VREGVVYDLVPQRRQQGPGLVPINMADRIGSTAQHLALTRGEPTVPLT
jgi:hypothetical protein